MMSDQLHCVLTTSPKNPGAIPVVFLHGFGGMAAQWHELQSQIAQYAPTLAYDLPGHGRSIDYPQSGPPKVAAKAVIADLQGRGISKAHIVGHSMGGAIACLITLFTSELVAGLTLLAPGGFGPEINMEVLKKWAKAKTESEIREVLPHFFATDFQLPDTYVALHCQARQTPGANGALIEIANAMTVNGEQGQLPLDDILAKDVAISLVWGNHDAILPVSQAVSPSNKMDLHILKGVGHSPAEENLATVKAIIVSQLR